MHNIYLQAVATIEDMLVYMEVPPDRNCTCHINPPCHDCVDFSHLRDVHHSAQYMIKLLKAHDLIDPSPPTPPEIPK